LDEIRRGGEAAELTQAQAAARIFRSLKWWQAVEAPPDSTMCRPLAIELWALWQMLAADSDADAVAQLRELRRQQRAALVRD
jgi:hypothetical protein